ncbi:MAG TPA: hypothetical protein VHZ51_10155 [Ktedonobacteraceae bacterium]|nr:hypothetical protein [Ktedonobacteraceae bacterium]
MTTNEEQSVPYGKFPLKTLLQALTAATAFTHWSANVVAAVSVVATRLPFQVCRSHLPPSFLKRIYRN